MAGRRYTEHQGSFREDQASVTHRMANILIKLNLALLGLCGFGYCMTKTSTEGAASV